MSRRLCVLAGAVLLGLVTAQVEAASVPIAFLYERTLEVSGGPEPRGMMLFGLALLGLARQLRRVWRPVAS